MFKSDYSEHVKDKRRWKSDFDRATATANKHFATLEELIQSNKQRMEYNQLAIKHILDAQMIAQLCEAQELQDKK